ncbi:unnamed protein product [Owenia fusiformis]|uniref:DNA repair and recombination protein RAD54B n=1 Tax=Owenia fusiformis TaxID=6347 RepID=A0A8S4Q753_OWEFU|nr:unnamed protein product [Owenia fusiformis]
MWCKRSNKKHKKWEGDAILQAKGRSVSLFDMEGKEIGKATGYKIAELQNLTEGETLPIGGKQIEVMGYVTPEQFSSGKCFTSAGQVEIQQEVNPKPKSFKPFVKPTKLHTNGGNPLHRAKIVKVSGPRFDPTMVDALVMPRPNQAHQWQLNKEGLAVIDVVVDPYISTHLRPHQRDGVVFLYECIMGFRNFHGNGAILADDMGLGKTLQCISLVWTLLKQGPYGGKAVLKKILIVTPGSLVKNWMREFKKWLGTERIQVFTVDQDNKVQEFIKCGIHPVMIISYEMFIRSLESLKAVTFDLVICDEGHRLKNTTIKTTSSLMSLPTRRRIVLTGTPIQNDLQEFFSIVEFTNPGVLGSSSAFRRVYEDPIITSKQPRATSEEKEIGGQRAAELNRLTGMFVLRRTQEINNRYLPPKVELVIFCPPTELQLNIYRKLIASRLVRSCFSRNSNGSPHLMCIAAMKKLCNHPWLLFEKAKESEEAFNLDSENDEESLYQDIFSLYPDQFEELILHPAASGKLTVLQGILQELSASKERVVLVSNYTQTLNILEHMCQRSNYTYVRLDGQTPTAKRQQLVENFNSKYSDTFIFLLSSKAGGVGLNLIGASRLVLYDIDWNPANDLQAMARVWRDGQRKKVYIYRLFTTGTIEEKVYQRQISKQGLSGAVMDSKTTIQNVKFSLEDLKDLFTLRDETDCDTHDLLNCKCETSSNIESSTGQENNTRRCQLGATKNTKQKKNLSMDELMSWQHIPRNNLESLNQDYHLGNSEAGISYVFWQESNKGSE